MALNKGVAPSTVKSGLDEIFFSEYMQAPGPQFATASDPYVFRQKTTDRSGENTEVGQDGGEWTKNNAESGIPAEATPRVGDAKFQLVEKWMQDLPIPQDYIEDELYGTIEENVRKMALKAKNTQDKNAAGIYRGAFTTSTTNNGTALCSATQSNLNGDTVDNLVSGALSETTLNTAITKLVEQVDQAGDITGHEAHCLVVPPALFKTACEIVDSELRSGTANNDDNIYSSKYGIVVKQLKHLGAAANGSDTAWFLLSKYHNVCRWVRIPVTTSYVEPKYETGHVGKYRGRFREVVAAITYEGLVGGTGL